MEYQNGAGERFPLPDRPPEPPEAVYRPAAEDEEAELTLAFVREHAEEFVDFVNDWDGCVLLDFLEANRWQWNRWRRQAREGRWGTAGW